MTSPPPVPAAGDGWRLVCERLDAHGPHSWMGRDVGEPRLDRYWCPGVQPPVPAADGEGRVVPPSASVGPRTGVAGTSGPDDAFIELSDCACYWCLDEQTIRGRNNRVPSTHLRLGTFMVLCPECGNKRCPKASAHWQQCTESNEPGQHGSTYGDGMPEPVTRLRPSLVEEDRQLVAWINEQIPLPPAAAPTEKETADERHD